MRLTELLRTDWPGLGGDAEITGLTADSREVAPGYLFAALPGSRHDGACFIAEALSRGAAALLVPESLEGRSADVPVVRAGDPRRELALMAARYYPGAPETIAAVTGTAGKTSVVEFARQLWRAGGRRAASLGTLGIRADVPVADIAHTTPDPVTLHRAVDALARAGVDCLGLEASSHGLDQRRLDGLAIFAGAFTSFSRDHLDYHGDAEDYLRAKLRLFNTVMAIGGTAVVNADCAVAERVFAACRARSLDVVTYGRGQCDLALRRATPTAEGQRLELEIFGCSLDVVLPLGGEFQAMNALAAFGLVLASGGDKDGAVAALARLRGVPGRLQWVGALANGARVYVDYAHKPAALEQVLATLRPMTAGRLVALFGCGGDRDPGKRREMGEIAARLADHAIVTDDNPRSEDPAAIRAAVLAGCPGAEEIGERGAAIAGAISSLAAGDILLLAGKGHEQGQYVGDEVCPFDDAEEARARIREQGGRTS